MQTPAWFNDWFKQTYQQFLTTQSPLLDPNHIQDISQSFPTYKNIQTSQPKPANVAIVKLNGGLGTSMGCNGPKSLIQCQPNGNTLPFNSNKT